MRWIRGIIVVCMASLSMLPVAAESAAAPSDMIRAEDLPTTTPIKHLVTVMQENHSFDNYFGTYPGADGIPAGTCMPNDPADPSLGCVEPFDIGGQAIVDLGHTGLVFDDQFADGRMDGFVSAHADRSRDAGQQAMGYYDDDDLPFYWNVADNYVLFDRFFTSAFGGSVRNHFFWVTGSPGNEKSDSLRPEGFDDVPTIFDSLQAAGVSWKFYVQNYDPEINFRAEVDSERASQLIWVPPLNYNRFIDDPALSSRIVSLEEFYDDVANDTLPAVSYVVPSGASEHPPGSIQAGERFIRTLVTSVMRSSSWESTALTWTYDDWGGWYDHVPPPKVDQFGYGFRAPALLVSAYAKPGHIESSTLDFTSILKFIEENWEIAPLTERDAAANNFLGVFDFEAPPRDPVLLSTNRDDEPIIRPRTDIVYASYGSALGGTVLLVSLTGLWGVGARRRRIGLVR